GAIALEIAATDDDGVENPRRFGGRQIDDGIEASFLRQRDGRLDQRSDIDAAGDERAKALRAAADLRNGDVRAGEAELFEQNADGNVGLGTEGADAEDLAFQFAHPDPRLTNLDYTNCFPH